jgi:hypothetical protein
MTCCGKCAVTVGVKALRPERCKTAVDVAHKKCKREVRRPEPSNLPFAHFWRA